MTIMLTIGAFAAAYVAAYVLTPYSARLAKRLGVVDRPDPSGHKKHAAPTPYLGGLALFAGLLVAAPLLLVLPIDPATVPIGRYGITVGIGLAVGLMGLIDDARTLPRTLRLGAQAVAAIGVWALGFRVEAASWEALNLFLTVIWMIGITNAFNLLDNMDGLSAGIAGVAAIAIAAMGLLNDLPVLPLVAAGVAGASLGFLVHNRYPAKIFMGDAGSLFLGFLLALLGLKLEFDNLVQVTFLVPVVVLGVPIFDTTLVVVDRIRHRRPVFLGGADHVSHRLVAMGFPVKIAVGILYLVALCLGWIGLVISRSNVQVGWMLLGFVLTLGAFFGGVLLRVPIYENKVARRMRAIEPLAEVPAEPSKPAEQLRG